MNRSEPTSPLPESGDRFRWYLAGVRAAISIPGLVLVLSFIGFAALARESGFTLAQALFMVAIIWALPGKVVLIAAVVAGTSLPATALAVALSSVRLMPMVVAIVPEMRHEKTRPWVLYFLSHFVAVTAWVIAMERFRTVPRDMRTIFYFGLGSTLVLANVAETAIFYSVSARLPVEVSAAFFLLTPVYFLTSLWTSARESAGHHALVLGLALGPVFHYLFPQLALLIAGVGGGFIAFALHRLRAGSTA